MSVPKSVIRFNKDGVQYVSSCDRVQYTIKELTRAALRDVGKYLSRTFRINFYKAMRRRTGKAGRSARYQVFASKNTIYPRVEINLWGPGKKLPGWYSTYQEVGNEKVKRMQILRDTAHDSVAEIIKIESQYLSALESEAEALALCESEDDYEGGADDEI